MISLEILARPETEVMVENGSWILGVLEVMKDTPNAHPLTFGEGSLGFVAKKISQVDMFFKIPPDRLGRPPRWSPVPGGKWYENGSKIYSKMFEIYKDMKLYVDINIW